MAANEVPVAFLNARLFDPGSEIAGDGGLLVDGGRIKAVGSGVTRETIGDDVAVVDCRGLVLAPGLVDMRVFVGEPGAEHKETLESASLAAAAGGITTFATMPNTDPVIDDISLVEFMERRARMDALVNVVPMAAATKGLHGSQMTEIGLMKDAGAVAFTDGDRAVTDAAVMRRLLSYSTYHDALIVQHAEEPSLANSGCVNEGEVAMRLGLAGIPKAAEVIVIERDLRLVELTGARYHVSTVSCAESVDAIRRAKDRGLPVTCGTSVNHLTLNENDIGPYRTFFKLSPPLRGEADRNAVVLGVIDGAIDVIVSDHCPQDQESKRQPFAQAAFGAVGLETMFAALLALHHNSDVGLDVLVRALTEAPARLMGLESGRLAPHAPADFILVDLERPWTVEPERLRSKSKNTPFEGRRFHGRVVRTVVAGRTVFELD